jgi:hypothetical protein
MALPYSFVSFKRYMNSHTIFLGICISYETVEKVLGAHFCFSRI